MNDVGPDVRTARRGRFGSPAHGLRFRVVTPLALAGVVLVAVVPMPTLVAGSECDVDRVVLTPTARPETSQFVSWRGPPSSDRVLVRSADTSTVWIVEGSISDVIAGRAYHTAQLTGLAPGGEYEYRIPSDDGCVEWRGFATSTGAEAPFTFLHFGDAQQGLRSTWPTVVRAALERAPDAAATVHSGDLVDAGVEAQWTAWFDGLGTAAATGQVIAAPGNHEYEADPQLRRWKAQFEYPRKHPTAEAARERAVGRLGECGPDVEDAARTVAQHWSRAAADSIYSVDLNGVRFLVLNATRHAEFLTPPGLHADAPCEGLERLWLGLQAAWIEQHLGDPSVRWTVVVMHRPVFSVTQGRDEPALRAALLPVLQRNDVDLVLMGHDHAYARGHLESDSLHGTSASGPVFVVANAGDRHRRLAPEHEDGWVANGAHHVVRVAGISTYQVVAISGNTLEFTSYVAAVASSSSARVGQPLDAFTITKDERGKRVEWAEAGLSVAERSGSRLGKPDRAAQ